jgi:cytochrome c biogenesis protein CcdA
MGLNLLGVLKFQFPNGPDIKIIEDKIPTFIAPFAIGTTFGLASSPCITPVLATLLAWVSQAKNPTISVIFLFFFGIGQVTPLIVAGATTENLKQFLAIRKFTQIIPTLSGIFLVFSAGLLTSLGPCSLSLLPVTIAYIGGTEKNKFKLISFSGGVVFSLVALGAVSGLLGKIYGQIPSYYTSFVALIAIIMGLNLFFSVPPT